MASMKTMISCLILLLVTYAYSAPIESEYISTTSEYELTTEKQFSQRESTDKVETTTDYELTSTSTTRKGQTSAESNSEEVTKRGVTNPVEDKTLCNAEPCNDKRSSATEEPEKRSTSTDEPEKRSTATEEPEKRSTATEEPEKRSTATEEPEKRSTSTDEPEKRSTATDEPEKRSTATEEPEKRSTATDEPEKRSTATDEPEKREVENYSFTTLETSTDFNRRAIHPVDDKDMSESSTTVHTDGKQPEMNKDTETLSSVDSFARVTGLLKDETTDTPVETVRITKTISVVPGKISQTKVSKNVVTKTTDDKPLSQGQNHVVV